MFIITKWTKHVTDSGKTETIKAKPDHLNCEFRLLDGDRHVIAYGYADSDDDDMAFNPLDRYTDEYGVTEIQYKNPTTGVWETL